MSWCNCYHENINNLNIFEDRISCQFCSADVTHSSLIQALLLQALSSRDERISLRAEIDLLKDVVLILSNKIDKEENKKEIIQDTRKKKYVDKTSTLFDT
jgi:hypothetical protein